MADIDFPSNPTVGQHYVFGNGTWTWDGVKWTAYPGALAVPDAPSDGQTYGRNNAAWVIASSGGGGGGGGGGITEAPTDGTSYARKSAAWAHLSHTDITDWDISIPAAYTLPTASTTVLGGVKVDGSTVTIAGGVITSHAAGGGGASVTISDTAPVSPNVGDLWWDSVGGQLYLRYNDGNTTQWVPTVNSGVAAAAVPPPYTDNKIINGDMRIDARNNGVSGTATGYTVDRWQYAGTVANKGNWQRLLALSGGPLQMAGFNYYLGFNSTSAYAVTAGDVFYFSQPIEADMVGDLAWGTAGAQPVTLSFWALSSLTGTFGGSIRNYPVPSTRSYPFTFSLPAANTWTKIVITIPGDTAGTWVLSGNAAALGVAFNLGAGSTFSGPAGAWANGNYTSANGAVSTVGTNGANFFLTGVKLEVGTVATPFNRYSLSKCMADCQRYYQIGTMAYSGYAANAGAVYYFTQPLGNNMRASPTIAFGVPTYTNSSGLSLNSVGASFVSVYASSVAAGGGAVSFSFTASAEL